MCDVGCVIFGCVREAAGGGEEDAAGCNDKNKNPAIECGEKWPRKTKHNSQKA